MFDLDRSKVFLLFKSAAKKPKSVYSEHALLFPPISEEEKFLSDLNLDETQPLSSGPLLDPVLAPLPWDSRSRDSKASRVTQSLRSQGGYTSLASSVFVQESRHTGKSFLALKAGRGSYTRQYIVMKSPRHESLVSNLI